jgi:hypothetical protein
MENNPLYLPLLIQVALSVLILFWLAYSRVSRIAKQGLKEIRKTGFPLHENNASDNFKNQFEVPVLFYALCFFFIVSGGTTQSVAIAAWVFVVFRIIHALIQLTKNIIFPYRFLTFLISVIALTFMLAVAFIQVLN